MTAVPVPAAAGPVEAAVDLALVRMLDTPGLAHLVTPDSSPALRLLFTAVVEGAHTRRHLGREVTVHLRDRAGQVIGQLGVRLVLTAPDAQPDPRAWAVTHMLGTPAGGTYTEVVFVDHPEDGDGAPLPERTLDDLVRQVAHEVYPGGWAFHYRPQQVPASVLAYGTRLRERVELLDVELWS